MASQTKLIAILILSLCLIAPLMRATKFDFCKKNEDYAVEVTAVNIDPEPVASGKPATFSISATTADPIEEGTLSIEVSLFGIRIHTENHDLCKKTTCPVSAGNFVVSHTQTLPSFTPHGSYKLKMRMRDSEKELTCVTFSFSIGSGLSVADS